jgi:HPt (histidine-containing phosphotransfer) domain-containing protein
MAMSSVLFLSGNSVKPIDPSKLLDELCGQPELITRLLHTFQAETQKDIDLLDSAIAARDSASVTILAHRLKGSAATVGAESLKFRAAQIEGHGRRGELELVSDQMPGLHTEFERLCSFMRELHNLE